MKGVAKDVAQSASQTNRSLDINTLWNTARASQWNSALQKYYDMLSPGAAQLDRQLEIIHSEDIGLLTTEEFYSFLHDQYFVWKYTQKNRLATTRKQLERYITDDRMDELALIKKHLFQANCDNIRECLTIATQMRGLGTAGASGLLAILFPGFFGTVDQFVVKSLLAVEGLSERETIEKMKPTFLSIDDGVVLISIMRKQAKNLNRLFSTNIWTPRKIDMVLWSVGR